jgi:hypothetical protein
VVRHPLWKSTFCSHALRLWVGSRAFTLWLLAITWRCWGCQWRFCCLCCSLWFKTTIYLFMLESKQGWRSLYICSRQSVCRSILFDQQSWINDQWNLCLSWTQSLSVIETRKLAKLCGTIRTRIQKNLWCPMIAIRDCVQLMVSSIQPCS